MGRSLMHFLEMPAWWQVSTTSVTSLYDSGASSITSFGLATLQHASAAVFGILYAHLQLPLQSPQGQTPGISSLPAELPQSGLKAVCRTKGK